MKELEGEMSHLTETVEQHMDLLEACVWATEQSAVSLSHICSKEEKTTGEGDNAQVGLGMDGVLSAEGGAATLSSCGIPNHPSTPHPLSSCRKPQEFYGRVPWDAYHTQFEILAEAQAWDS